MSSDNIIIDKYNTSVFHITIQKTYDPSQTYDAIGFMKDGYFNGILNIIVDGHIVHKIAYKNGHPNFKGNQE